MTVIYRYQSRRRTAANWTSGNEVLYDGEIGYETDTGKFKIGDGVTAWNSIADYFEAGAGGGGGGTWGSITGTLSNQTDLNSALSAKLASSAVSAFGLTLIDDADASAARTTLGLGTAATSATSAFEASGAVSTHNAVTTAHGISAFGATLVDDADASAARTTLGLGSLATQSGTFSGTSSGTNTGDQTSIVGITGTLAQFNTACTDANFLGGESGAAEIDFGAWPGANEASVVVTGQTAIAAGSDIVTTISREATADHTVGDATYAALLVGLSAGNIVAGTGFTIYARSLEKMQGKFAVRWLWT